MTRSAVHGLVSVELVSADPEKLAEFYRRVFDIEFEREVYGYSYPYFVSTGSSARGLVIHDIRNFPPGRAHCGTARFLLQIEDLETLKQRLTQHGIELEEPPRNLGFERLPWFSYWGRWVISIRDPDGNVVLFRQFENELPRNRFEMFKLTLASTYTDLKTVLQFKVVDRLQYRLGRIPIRTRDLTGYTHLVASREGLYAVNGRQWTKIISGVFFGVTVKDGCIYCYQAHDIYDTGILLSRIQLRGKPLRVRGKLLGRVIKLELDGNRIRRESVVVTGLHTNCHQMDFIGDKLHIIDTFCQKIQRFDSSFELEEEFFPLGSEFASHKSGPDRYIVPGRNYVHINSIVAEQGSVYLLLHNGLSSGKHSELIQTDENFEVKNRFTVPGAGCHNVVFLEDGEWLMCDSRGGNLINRHGVVVHVGELLTRGLSVDKDTVVVGESGYATRLGRRYVPGNVHFFDRNYQRLSSLRLPAAPTDIRKIDGQDLSLSNVTEL
ncbi:VOC family protein [Mycobacterium sp. E740]|uniref:VOC family protein n=1 Tax=Mycobacterium sp. E740 TaxID=1834149 RepID=UPI0009EE4F44|nr:VOC family protein [Mycobacterium sp. E740]